jgi:hypothetical protein
VILGYPGLFDGEIKLFETPTHNRTPMQGVTDYIGRVNLMIANALGNSVNSFTWNEEGSSR